MQPMLRLACLVIALMLPMVGCETTTMIRQKGYTAMRQGDLNLAHHHFARAAQKSPHDYLSHYYLGTVLLKQGRPQDAQLELERALVLRPYDPEMPERSKDLRDKLAEAMFQQGPVRYDALHNFLDEQARYSGKPEDYIRQARYLAKTGDIDSAKLAYQKAAYFAPKGDATPYLAIADFYAEHNNIPEAVASLKYAYFVDPENPDVANGLRKYGIVPGPTVAVEPPKPELLR